MYLELESLCFKKINGSTTKQQQEFYGERWTKKKNAKESANKYKHYFRQKSFQFARSSFIIFNSNLEKKEIVDQQSDCMPGHFDNCLGELRAKQSAALALRIVGKSTDNFDISREVLFQRGFCSLCN